ncbi:MAG: hypothetical protein AAF389_21535, partial [Gemmatimonadota bacterium]
VAAGCDAGTDPDVVEAFDAEAALEDMQALEASFGTTELAGFAALGGRTPFGPSPAGIDVIANLGAPSAADGGQAWAKDLASRLIRAHDELNDGPMAGPIISGWHRGTTFVYDPQSDDYQPDLTRTDAPETGVRFVIYEVDASGVPIVESEIGYADLIDEGDNSAEDIVLRLIVVEQDSTLLDYRVTLDHDATSGALTVLGFFAGDEAQLDFDIAVNANEVGDVTTLDITFDFGVEAHGLSVFGSLTGIEDGNDDGPGRIDITMQNRRDTVRIQLEADGQGMGDGSVNVNGDVFATMTVAAGEEPVFLNAAGEPLSGVEILVLVRIFDVVEDVFDFLEDIVDPVDELVLLGFIL